MQERYEQYSSRFLPNQIRYLLIGESPPFTPCGDTLKYFYNCENDRGGQILLSSVSYAILNKKYYQGRDDKEEYLLRLKNDNIFLVDATYEPINKIKNKAIRRSKIQEAYPRLKQDIGELPLMDNVDIMLIHNYVINAIGQCLRRDLEYRFHDIGFPRYYNDERFKDRIREVLRN